MTPQALLGAPESIQNVPGALWRAGGSPRAEELAVGMGALSFTNGAFVPVQVNNAVMVWFPSMLLPWIPLLSHCTEKKD